MEKEKKKIKLINKPSKVNNIKNIMKQIFKAGT